MGLSKAALLLIGLLGSSVLKNGRGDDDAEVADFDDEFNGGFQQESADAGQTSEKEVVLESVEYVPSDTSGLHFVDTFQSDFVEMGGWKKSSNEKFSGQWQLKTRATEALRGDKALYVMNEARHHAIARRFPMLKSNDGKTFILSYEVKFEEGLQCGGAYLKLFDSSSMSDVDEFDNLSPYVIMFGPDKCGATNKVHFILKMKNPVSGQWTEHQLTNPPTVPGDNLTHLYSLIIKPDDSFVIEVDGVDHRSGQLNESFSPVLQEPQEIEDEADEKPDDWVDEEFVPDPEAEKPDDWDEDAPREIPDAEAEIPSGWLESEPKYISDPDADQPEDWDEDEDGEWSAPQIFNPKCSGEGVTGCGKWEAPMVENPNYKGKWRAPMIKNVEFKGKWERRKIDNPNFYELSRPHALSPIDAVGFDLWTMQSHIAFDNILISNDEAAFRRFIKDNWLKRHNIEKSRVPKTEEPNKPNPVEEGSIVDKSMMVANALFTQYPTYIVVGAAGGIFALLLLCCVGGGKKKTSVKTSAEESEKDAKSTKKAPVAADKENKAEENGAGSRRGSAASKEAAVESSSKDESAGDLKQRKGKKPNREE